jgi:hypothetical protein
MKETTFIVSFNGYCFSFWLKAFDPVRSIQHVTGFEIRKGHRPWRWVKVYKGDYGLIYSEGRKGNEVVGWRLRGPFEFTTVE